MTVSKPLKDALKKARALIWSYQSAPAAPHSTGRRFGAMFSKGDLGGIELDGPELEAYRETLDELVTAAGRSGQLSRSVIEDKFIRTILIALDIRNKQSGVPIAARIAKASKDLEADLSKPSHVWTVHLPASLVVVPPGRAINFASAVFRLPTASWKASLRRSMAKIINANEVESEKVKASFNDAGLFELKVANVFNNKVVATFRVEAVDGTAAHELAKEHLNELTQALAFFGAATGPGRPRHEEEAPGGTYEQPTIGALGWSFDAGPYQIDIKRAKTDSRSNFFGVRLAEALIRKKLRTEVEARILEAVSWCGRATLAESRATAFLFYVIALESLIIGDFGEKTNTLQFRTARLLGRNIEGRQWIRGQVRQLYKLRSSIVHEGESRITPRDVAEAAKLLYWTIRRFLRDKKLRKMNANELAEWFDVEMLK